ncbi:MAG: IS3 family transposase [Candidatus Acidiferrales bacterium]
MEVRSTAQRIALEHRRRYGYRRICAELRRRGMQVNHKRVLRMMQKDNLLALRRRRFVVTTNSQHKFEVYLNLARRMKLSGQDQLWVADITYIRLKAEFHHSDRGLQYARGEYVDVLEKHGIVPSMSRPANPYDNASCESFIEDAETRGDLREPVR